jgi:hypothetical protein
MRGRGDLGYRWSMRPAERFEQIIAFLRTHLPSPLEEQELGDGTLVFTGGSPGEVIARLTRASVVIEEYAVRWETPYTPVLHPRRVGAVKWRRLSESVLMNVLGQLVKGAREARLSRYRACGSCGESTPPEWLLGEDTCQTCAEREMGSVH